MLRVKKQWRNLWVEVGQIKQNAQFITLRSVSFYYFIRDENMMDKYNKVDSKMHS
jgi:hypothetical protein